MAFTRGRSELGVTEIATLLSLPKSAVHRVLESLTASGFTVKEHERGKYRLGPRAFELSIATLGTVDLKALALPLMEELSRSTEETVTMSYAIDSMRVYVAQVESPHDVRMRIEVGRRAPLYAGASGRAMLCTYPEAELDEYLSRVKMHQLTANTIVDIDQLRTVLKQDLERGYAFSAGERDPYAAAAAAPICTATGRAIGVLSVCGPTARMDDGKIQDYGKRVAAAAKTLSEMLAGGKQA